MADPEVTAERAQDRLTRIYDEHLGRSDYQRRVREAVTIAREVIREYEAAREAELAVVRKEFQGEVDRERERAVKTAADLTAERKKAIEAVKSMDKLLELKDDHAALRFTAPVGEYGRHTPWTVDDLEEVLYDIRHAGGVGETEVLLSDRQVTTKVPYPETVVAARTRSEKPDRMPPGDDPRAGHLLTRKPGIHPLYGAAGCMLIVLLTALLCFVWPG